MHSNSSTTTATTIPVDSGFLSDVLLFDAEPSDGCSDDGARVPAPLPVAADVAAVMLGMVVVAKRGALPTVDDATPAANVGGTVVPEEALVVLVLGVVAVALVMVVLAVVRVVVVVVAVVADTVVVDVVVVVVVVVRTVVVVVLNVDWRMHNSEPASWFGFFVF